jgi:two-component system, LytTR family, response regulator
MRVIVVDDEAPARRRLIRMLRGATDVRVVAEAVSGPEAVETIGDVPADLVFLDVQMPGLDGFGVIEAVGSERMPRVVFVTAFDEYAVRAFEVRAIDYLLKPFPPERLDAVLTRVRREQGRPPAGRFDGLGSDAGREAPRAALPLPILHRLLVSQGSRDLLVPIAQVDCFEAAGNYVRVHVGPHEYLVRQTLSAIEQRVEPGRFLRTSRSTLVRTDAIAEIQPWFHGDRRVVLRTGRVLTWSRRFRARDRDTFV